MSESVVDGPSAPSDSGGAKSKNGTKGNRTGGLVLALILLFLIQPLIVITATAGILAFEKRKVRISRWCGAAAVIAVIGLLVSGFNVVAWASWIFARPSLPIIGDTVTDALSDTWPGLADIRTHGMIYAALISVPIGLLVTAVWAWWRSYQINQRGEHEGERYDSHRPVGFVDKAIAKRNTAVLSDGTWAEKHPGQVAIGTGKYGAVASIPTDDTRRTTLITGTTQSGKTRLANSIADQIARETHGGNIVLDFKGDHAMAARKAQLAEDLGVPFLHFSLSSKNGAHYRPPHPYAPPTPAHYDPFSRGNGSSKGAMLLNSVPRDGDAAAYFRAANEAVKLAWDIAAYTGIDRRTWDDGTPHSGLEVLNSMLDPETLINEGRKVTSAKIRAVNPSLGEGEARRAVASIQSRIAAYEGELTNKNSLLTSSLADVRSTIAGYINDSAAGAWLNNGSIPNLQIDILRAILNNEVVLFTLPAQEYPEMAAMIGAMVLLDIGNAVAALREHQDTIANADTEWAYHSGGNVAWNPMVLQVEELGSIRSTAAADALLGLLNKSADVEIRAVLSSQSIVDLDAVDGTGQWRERVLAQTGNFFSLKVPSASDDEVVCNYSGKVVKSMPRETRSVENNRWRIGIGAGSVGTVSGNPTELTRIPAGTASQLNLNQQLVWINQRSDHRAVHTLKGEGPNQWYEVIQAVPVYEPALGWDPFTRDDEELAATTDRRNAAAFALRDRLARDPVLHALTVNQHLDNPTAELPDAGGQGVAQGGGPADWNGDQPAGELTPQAAQWGQLSGQADPSAPADDTAADPAAAEPPVSPLAGLAHTDRPAAPQFDGFSDGVPLPDEPDQPSAPGGYDTDQSVDSRPQSWPESTQNSAPVQRPASRPASSSEPEPVGFDDFGWDQSGTAGTAEEPAGTDADDPFGWDTVADPQQDAQSDPAAADDPFSDAFAVALEEAGPATSRPAQPEPAQARPEPSRPVNQIDDDNFW